jgi:hypothetical protein
MRHSRWMRSSVQTACLVLALGAIVQPRAQDADTGSGNGPGAAAGSFRAAQDLGLDYSLRPADILNVPPGGAPPGSFRAAQDAGNSDAWSRRFGDRWSADGYQGPGVPPPWAGGRDQPLDSRTRF